MKNKMLTAVIFTYNHRASISRCIDSSAYSYCFNQCSYNGSIY